jgi:putative transposase
MKKNYQTQTTGARITGRTTPKKAKVDPRRDAHEAALALPDTVTVAIGELASELEEGLLAFAVGTGLRVLGVILDHEATALAGPKGVHDTDRGAVRHGTEDGLVALGGRQVSIRRPRLRSADRTSEVQLPTYQACTSTELLGRETLVRMMAKLSTRRYGAGLEPMGTAIEAASRSTSKSAVSRRFVAATETALGELMAGDLSGLDLVAIMIDGVHFATLVKDLLAGLRERGLDMTKPILAVLDGAKALCAGVQAVFDHPVIARCQLHKLRNVESKLPDDVARVVVKEMRAAYANPDALAAQGRLEALAKRIERSHPGAAGSLREGLAETLTIARLGVPPTLARTLRSTNAVESMIEICRDHSRNVKRWRDGEMALRWCAAGMVEAKKQFRRVNGHLHLRSLRTALEQHVEETITPRRYSADKEVAA